MVVKIITIFPELFREWVNTSIVHRAQQKQIVNIELIDLRKYASNKFMQVDDEAYGGGGMVMQAEPIVKAIQANIEPNNSVVCLLTPQGYLWNQSKARAMVDEAKDKTILLIAGRYEGIDARVENYVDEFICIGDYVVTGGELPAMIVAETLIRLLPGVINEQSLTSESFDDGLLDYSVYTRPQVFNGLSVPDVYLSGNHKMINEARFLSRIANTRKHRPDLYEKYLLDKKK